MIDYSFLGALKLGLKWLEWLAILFGIFILGLFQLSVWTLIPLLTTLIFYGSSEEIYHWLSPNGVSTDRIPYRLRRIWRRLKALIMLGSFCLYLVLLLEKITHPTQF